MFRHSLHGRQYFAAVIPTQEEGTDQGCCSRGWPLCSTRDTTERGYNQSSNQFHERYNEGGSTQGLSTVGKLPASMCVCLRQKACAFPFHLLH